MDNALGRLREDILVEDALLDDTLADLHHIVIAPVVLVESVAHLEIDRRHQLREHLLPRPARRLALWLPAGDRHDPLKTLVPHHHVHELAAVEFHMRLRDAVGAHQRVLNDTDERLGMARSHDLVRNRRDLCEFRRGLVGLRDVRVHLITVEVCVIRRRDGYIETEGVVGKHLDTVTHHRHAVKRRLTVE